MNFLQVIVNLIKNEKVFGLKPYYLKLLAISKLIESTILLEAVEEFSELEQTVFLRSLIKMIRKFQEAGQIPITQMCVTCRFFQPTFSR